MTFLPFLPFTARADVEAGSAQLEPVAASTVTAAAYPGGSGAVSAAAEPPSMIDSVTTSVTSTMQSAAGLMLRSAQDVTGQALDLIGVRYRFGGQTPDRGLDCSGLVKYVFEQVTGVAMPRSARDQAKVGEKVEPDDLQPGDLVFFNTRRAAYSHVGIYLGDNSFVHAPRQRSSVSIANMDRQYWKKRFNGARRLVGMMPGMVSIEAAKSLLQALPATAGEAAEK